MLVNTALNMWGKVRAVAIGEFEKCVSLIFIAADFYCALIDCFAVARAECKMCKRTQFGRSELTFFS